MWEYKQNISSDELYHWKYTRKYKNSKGNWVYIYPDDKLGIKRTIDTKITGNAYKQHRDEAFEKSNNAAIREFQNRQTAQSKHESAKNWDDAKEANKYEEEAKRNSYTANTFKRIQQEAQYDYEHKSLRGLAESSRKKAKNFVADTLEKWSHGIRGRR